MTELTINTIFRKLRITKNVRIERSAAQSLRDVAHFLPFEATKRKMCEVEFKTFSDDKVLNGGKIELFHDGDRRWEKTYQQLLSGGIPLFVAEYETGERYSDKNGRKGIIVSDGENGAICYPSESSYGGGSYSRKYHHIISHIGDRGLAEVGYRIFVRLRGAKIYWS